ncbi:MAG TPA: Smr/MutS family protein [Stellaceae bacterium]|jgi:DNA-nicking Smr family endonuclease
MAERRHRARAEDTDLWRRAMRDVAPLRERPDFAPPPEKQAAPVIVPMLPRMEPPAPATPNLPGLDRFAGIDRATAERLKRGKLVIEARLDLHGLTQAEAHRALAGFVGGSRANGLRCVLVITGRGAVGGGILRQAVPRWLDEPGLRRHLLAIAPAQSRDGGAGALYLLLRRSEVVLAAR